MRNQLLVEVIFRILFKTRVERYLARKMPKLRVLRDSNSEETSSSGGELDDYIPATGQSANNRMYEAILNDPVKLEQLLNAYPKRTDWESRLAGQGSNKDIDDAIDDEPPIAMQDIS